VKYGDGRRYQTVRHLGLREGYEVRIVEEWFCCVRGLGECVESKGDEDYQAVMRKLLVSLE
jgi:hypothetical protein